jgi:hypothetical protein
MKVGFTGSRRGMSEAQERAVATFLEQMRELSEAHHGDCVGADAAFHGLCLARGVQVHVHPPTDPKHRAFCSGADSEAPARGYQERNRDIVDASEALIATPGGFREVTRSGTWATIRYAKKAGRPVFLVFPDGMVLEE